MNTPTESADKTALSKIRELNGLTGPILDPPAYTYERIEKAMQEYATLRLTQAEEAHRKEIASYEEVLADNRRLVRELDEIISGKEGMAKQASLCDLIDPIKKIREERDVYKTIINSVIDTVSSEYPGYARELTEKLNNVAKQSLNNPQ